MNRIPIRKNAAVPRHHIVYHYKKSMSKPNLDSRSTTVRPVTTKPKNSVVVRPKPRVPRIVKSVKVVKSNVKPVSSKPSLMSKRTRNAKSTFDSGLPKIKSISGIGKGKILVMLAPGPSILEAEIEKLNGIQEIDIMTINKPDERAWPSDYWMFCDRTQYIRNKEFFHKYNKTIINTSSIKASHPKQIKIKNLPGKGFSVDMTKGFYIGRSTTFSAMQVAAWMEYDKIFIFGLDMCRVGKKLHSYGKNPDVPEKIRERRFKKEAEFYDTASKIMNENLRNKYYICSSYNPWSFVKKFNRLDQKEAVEYILKCTKEI